MCDPAKYLNGEPQNLPAAANDALAWLQFLNNLLKQRSLPRENQEILRRLNKAIEALGEFLPDAEPEYREDAPSAPS